MSKNLNLLLNDLACIANGYPKQVAKLDPNDKFLVEVDNRDVEDLLKKSLECLTANRPLFIANPDQLSFNL